MFGQPLNYTEIYCFKLNFSSPFLAKLLCVDRFILHVTAGVGKVQPASLIRPAETLCPPRGVALKHGLLIDFVKNVDLIYFIYSTCIRLHCLKMRPAGPNTINMACKQKKIAHSCVNA